MNPLAIMEIFLLNLLHFNSTVKTQISSYLSVTCDSDGRF